MSDANRTSVILIREGTALPPNFSVECNAFFPGWRIVTSPDRSKLTRDMESAHWNFFYRAGDTRATVLGRDRLRSLRRAVKRVLAKQPHQNFNALEVTTVTPKRFLGLPFLSIVAHLRHIQESSALIPAKAVAPMVPDQLPEPPSTNGDELRTLGDYAAAK